MKKTFYFLFILLLTFAANNLFAQWTETSPTGASGQVYSISVVTDDIVWVGHNLGAVSRTTNGGTNWTQVGGGPIGSAGVYNIFGVSDQVCLCTTSPAATYVYLTTNGGANWTQVFTQPGGFINAIWMTSPTNGFMTGDPVSSRWSLWKTTNGGVNWDSTGLYLSAQSGEAGWNNALSIIGSHIWFTTNQAWIYHSSDNGATFNPQTIPAAASTYGYVWFNSATLGMGSVNLLPTITTNGGANWVYASAPGGSGNIAGIIGTGTNFWAIRNGFTAIFKTTNNGVNWTTDYTSSSGGFTHIGLSRDGYAAYAGKANGQVAKNPNVTIGIKQISSQVPSNYILEQNYPNPFNPVTNIKYSIPKPGFVSLIIYDMLGREVMTLVNQNQNIGTYLVDVDGSKLSSGIYFYTLKSGNFTESKRMVMAK